MSEDEVGRRAGSADEPDYWAMHVTVVDAIRHLPATGLIDNDAHEVLQRLRDLGLPIPPRPPDDPFADDWDE